MLNWNFNRIFVLRMIEKPYSYLFKNGFSQSKARRISNGKIDKVSLADLEKLCLLFNVSPNEFLEWKEDSNKPLPANHALRKYSREQVSIDIIRELSSIPVDKLQDAYNLIRNIER